MCIQMLTKKFYKKKKRILSSNYPIIKDSSITGKVSIVSSCLENDKIAYYFMIKNFKKIFVYYSKDYEQQFKINDIVTIYDYTKGNVYVVNSLKIINL